jgi:DNA-binding IclR family transcriptional regulator
LLRLVPLAIRSAPVKVIGARRYRHPVPRPSPQTDRVVTLLNLLAGNPSAGMSIAEIARRLGINKATCYPMLAALQDAGWLVRHPVRRTFHLGPALVPVGAAAASSLPTAELVHAALAELAADLGLVCAAIAAADEHVVVLDQSWPPSHAVPTLRPGQRLPFRPPWGSVFVAWADDDAIDRWLARGSGDPAAWRRVLDGVRDLGGVVEVDESLSERVRDRTGGIDASATREELQSVVERLVEELSRQRDPVVAHLEDDRSYPVSSINAPVVGAGGEVTLAIAVMAFPGPLPGRDIRRILTRVQAAAAALR